MISGWKLWINSSKFICFIKKHLSTITYQSCHRFTNKIGLKKSRKKKKTQTTIFDINGMKNVLKI